MEVKYKDMIVKQQTPYRTFSGTYQRFREGTQFNVQFITGESGAGKTSLANLLLDEIADSDESTLIVSGLCYIHSEYNIPYQPFKEILKDLILDVTRNEQSKEEQSKRSKTIKNALSFTAKMICDHAPDLIGSFIPGASILNALGSHFFPEKENNDMSIDEAKILEQYMDVIKAISERYRIIIFIDDLQWIDNMSVNLLYQLMKGLKNHPVLFIGSFRSTDILTGGQTHSLAKLINEVKINYGNVFIDLDKVSLDEKRQFLVDLLNIEQNQFDSEFTAKLFQHTQGNPLFVSELINLLKENNDIFLNTEGYWINRSDFSLNEYPAKIEGIIQERIGKLEDSLIETLSHASVQGNHFIAQVLSLTMGQSEKEVLMTLSKTLQKQHNLVSETNCFRNGQQIISKFNFSNYIFRQYLYQELSFSQKMLLHSEIAGILEDIFKNNIEEVAPDIAQHYELSGEYEKAFEYLLMTINSTLKVSAYAEAEGMINKAINYLIEQNLKQQELSTYFDLSYKKYVCLRSIRGWGAIEVYNLLLELEELSKQLSDYHLHAPILFGIWTVHLSRLELKSCVVIAGENLSIATAKDNKTDEATALIALINSYIWTGNIHKASQYLEQLHQIVLSNEVSELDSAFTLFFSYILENEKGVYDKVAIIKKQIYDKIQSTDEPFLQTILYQSIAWVAFNNEDLLELKTSCQELLEVSTRYNFVFYTAIGNIFSARYLLEENPQQAELLVKESYELLLKVTDSNITIMHSVYGLILSTIYWKTGQEEQFVHTINQVIKTALEHYELLYIQDLYLLKYNYLLQVNQHAPSNELMEKIKKEAQQSGSLRVLNQINSITN